MDLNYYFEPVSLNRPSDSIGFSESMFGRNIRIHTASTPIDEISNYQIALLGVNEDRNSSNTGSANAADQIRQKLYELFRINDKLKIIDLGNLKATAAAEDTYYGLRDVMMDLLNNQVTTIVMGGTQDISAGIFMGFEQHFSTVNLVSIDSKIDMNDGDLDSTTWMNYVLKSPKLFRCTCMGQQQYLVNPAHTERMDLKEFDLIRLGALRSNPAISEPFLRDAHFVSFDIGAVKQSEAPATQFPSPNGLLAEEACQIARYSGLSDLVSCFSLFEVNPAFDRNNQTTHLAAQVIWYFIEGFASRKKEKPAQDQAEFKVFMVNHQDMEHTLTFYKSLITGRWWMEIPDMKTGKQMVVACSQEEYQQACNHDIPEMWWKAFQRIN